MKTWSRIDQKCQIRIRIETNADLQHCHSPYVFGVATGTFSTKKGKLSADPDPHK
jgi:hypothetical protein